MPRDTYIQFSVDMPMSPVVLPLRDSACVLWMRSVFWTAQNAPDLWVPRSARIALGGSKRDADALADAGLWLADDGGHWLVRNDLWKVVREYREKVPAWMRDAVLQRDGYACLQCGGAGDLQMDHIYPWSRGGQTTVENLQTLCGPCNRRKGARIDGLAEDR